MTLNPEPGTNVVSTFNKLWETARIVIRASDSYLKRSVGLSAGKFIVLMVLFFGGERMSSSQLAERTCTQPHNITALIQGLKQQDLVRAKKGTRDSRFVYIILTAKGKTLVEDAMPAVRDFVNQAMASIDKTELILLNRLLTTIEKNVTID